MGLCSSAHTSYALRQTEKLGAGSDAQARIIGLFLFEGDATGGLSTGLGRSPRPGSRASAAAATTTSTSAAARTATAAAALHHHMRCRRGARARPPSRRRRATAADPGGARRPSTSQSTPNSSIRASAAIPRRSGAGAALVIKSNGEAGKLGGAGEVILCLKDSEFKY